MALAFRRSSGERGFITVAYAAMLTAIMGFTGLAVDVGYLQYQKRRIQAAADAAAMGALREKELGNTDLVIAGQNDSSLNGFTDGSNNTTVTVVTPPSSGIYSGDTSAIQATVQRTIPTFFMQVFGQRSVTIAATAVTRTTTTYGSIGGCIFVLDPSASKTFWVHGTLTLATSCSVVVNSTDTQAFVAAGTSNILLKSNAQLGVAGNWSVGSNTTITSNGAAVSPVRIQQFNDPLKSVAAPTASGLTVRNADASNQKTVDKNSGITTLQPGVYCGGLNLKDTNGGTLTLTSGTYVLAGGGLTINSSANVVATAANGGVMFYNTSSTGWGCSGSTVQAGAIIINGGGQTNLAALVSSDMTFTGASNAVGMLFFDDRTATSGLGLKHQINGGATDTFDGAVYMPNAALYFTGTSSSGGYLILVSNTLEIGGTANLTNDFTTLATVSTLAPASTGGGLVQ